MPAYLSILLKLPSAVSRPLLNRIRGRMNLDGAVQAVAAELELNAQLVVVCEPHGSGASPATVGPVLETQQWDKHHSDLSLLRGWDSQLLTDAELAYTALKVTKARGAWPPLSGELHELSERFRQTKI